MVISSKSACAISVKLYSDPIVPGDFLASIHCCLMWDDLFSGVVYERILWDHNI